MRLGMKLGWLVLLWLSAVPLSAQGQSIDLRPGLCGTILADAAAPMTVRRATYRCGTAAPSAAAQGWLWLRLDATRLQGLQPGWRVAFDQTRFRKVALLVDTVEGSRRTVLDHQALDGHWAPGGRLFFTINQPGTAVRGLYLGFAGIDDLSLIRRLDAQPADGPGSTDAPWLWIMGLFTGTVLSALCYNLVIGPVRQRVQRHWTYRRWYVLWASLSLIYGLIWSNVAGFLVPGLVGPMAVRVDYVLVGLLIAVGNGFFFALVDEERLPAWMPRGGRLLGYAGIVAGLVASIGAPVPPVLSDRALNVLAGIATLWVGLAGMVALWRGSRAARFYLLGWGPVIVMLLARLGRNLGLVPSSDSIDMATFSAFAFEALVLSLAIADRFERLRTERDQARTARDVEQAEARAIHLSAQTDFLTGLGNRQRFQHDVTSLIDSGHGFTLYLVDMDYLKQVNDRLGHAGGDALLRQVGRMLADVAEEQGGFAARIGGDEFALLLRDDMMTGPALDQVQGATWHFAEERGVISLSIGSARFPEDADAPDLLYQNADLALYKAKRLGRGRHQSYHPLLRVDRRAQAALANDAEAALQRGEFRLFLQPIVDLASRRVEGHEALLRWQHPIYGLMAPSQFETVLTSSTVAPRIQAWVLESALAHLRDANGSIGRLGVNFTSLQLAEPGAARRVLDRLAHHGVAPGLLCVEVTESVMLDRGAEAVVQTLHELSAAGIKLALDDFGTGFASLIHLRRLPIDTIKIDRSFTAGVVEDDQGAAAIIHAIVSLGDDLGKAVVAEGVETEAQAVALRALGCRLGQGYLYGMPRAAAAA